ncbi:hypothetical protein [Curtobacterium sp. KT1]|uniref:DUF7255 family protein n=1 Tax=Curtobacterium sp. KT1 TaxID=3372858 RepID=UPI0037BEB2CF
MLIEAGLIRATARPRPPRLADLSGPLRSEVLGLYRQLGGKLDEPLLRPGAWDLPYSDVIVELDEDMHFNRYRTLTLEARFAAVFPWAAAYRQHAGAHERRAGTGGRRWTSPSSERMFGPADEKWVFNRGGAPRWKQRALYDAIKDAAAAAGLVQLARVSIYDSVDGICIEEALRGRETIAPDSLRRFVESRSATQA